MPKPVYTLRAYIRSFTNPNKKYTIKRRDDGKYSCSCPAWIFNHSGDRTCKHLNAIFEDGDKLEKIFMHADKYVLEIDGAKWEVIKDAVPTKTGGK